MRYAIYPLGTATGKVSLRLIVDAGSLQERDDERGYAHFVEHMAFNGTRHFPSGELVKALQREGVGFGPHVNAHTLIRQTSYEIDLTQNTPDRLALGFRVLRDFSDGILFEPREVKKERGVILSEDVARKLWDNYYVPYIKGWAAASGHFRSDDIKIGSILAYIGSNSSATYFPTQVMLSDTESHDIELKVLPTPHFEGCEKVSVQQGAGMAVAKTTDAEVEASVVFLKWFTQPENNIAFAVGSGYLPVTHAANDMDAIHSSGLALTGNMENVLTEAVEAVNTNEMYTTKAFEGGTDARSKLNYSMSDLATADRATVEERLAAGESAEEAEAGFLTDEYFEAWYQSLCDALSQYEG